MVMKREDPMCHCEALTVPFHSVNHCTVPTPQTFPTSHPLLRVIIFPAVLTPPPNRPSPPSSLIIHVWQGWMDYLEMERLQGGYMQERTEE